MGYQQLPVTPYQPQQENALDQYARIQQLKGMQGQQQLQQQAIQAGQLQNQTAQLQLQQAEQGKKDQDAFRQAMADPSMQGKTIGEVADTLAKAGHISPAAWQNAKKTDLEQRKELAGLTEAELKNRKAAHDATQELYNNVMNMPDQQLAASWPQIAQQYDAIPGNQKMPLDPNQPMSKQQLAQFGPMMDMGNTYFDQEMKRRTSAADLQLKQNEAAQGGTSDTARFISNYLKSNNLPNTPANQLQAQRQYNKETKVDPGVARLQVLGGFGMEVADPNNPGQTMIVRRDTTGVPGKSSASVTVPRKEAEYMTSGSGGKQLNAFNTAIVHLDTLQRLAGDLNNTDLRVVNRAKQIWAKETGNPAPINYDAAVNAMSGEVAAALKASGATDKEIEHVQATFKKDLANPQQVGAINTYRELLQGKKNQLVNQYQQGMQGKPNFGQQGNGMVTMRAPNGMTKPVPADQVEHYKSLGATVAQ